jgi:glycosyltransferase involved in cell wall biosynthesis
MDNSSENNINRSPLVSIIMLTYNRAEYIALAIESALTQTYTNWELIIIDDGSTDNTAAIVTTYLRDTRLRYIKDTTNKGLFARRHESLSYPTGTYIAILDSDDIWSDPKKLEKQVAFMESHPECAVVGTFITLIDQHGTEFGKNTYHTDDGAIRRTLLTRNQFANSSTLMRASAVAKTAGYRNFAPCEDLELFLQLGAFGTFANLPEYMLAYRIHPGGESARKVKVARQVLKLAPLHRHAYPGYWKIVMKMNLLIILSKLGLK